MAGTLHRQEKREGFPISGELVPVPKSAKTALLL